MSSTAGAPPALECRLASGERLRVRIVEPPLAGPHRAVEYWWRDVREAVVDGAWAADSLDRFIFGELDGQIVGSMLYHAPRDTRDVAVLEMVWTRADQRRKGIARRLLETLLADFRANGGQAMYLCTTNPHAFALYAACGFRPWIGDGMRYLAPGRAAFDDTYFADTGAAVARPATWGDLARVAALYNQPGPDWFIRDYPRRVFRGMRYEGHYRQVWLPAQRGDGTALVLASPARRVVGLASAVPRDSFAEQHVQVVDALAAPAYLGQLPVLLAALLVAVRERPAEILQAYVAACDADKLRVFEQCGFTVTARLRGHLRAGAQRHDLLLLTHTLDRACPPARAEADYYGARPAWREDQ